MKFTAILNVRDGKMISIIFTTYGYIYNAPVFDEDIKETYKEALRFLEKKHGEVVINKLVNFPYSFE